MTSELELRIDWADLDLFGHVNNVAFFRYVQAARVHYWEQIGLYQSFLVTRQGPILAASGCQFKKPLKYPGTVIIKTEVQFAKDSSFGLKHELYSNNELCATAEDVMVMFDFIKDEKLSIPSVFREKMKS